MSSPELCRDSKRDKASNDDAAESSSSAEHGPSCAGAFRSDCHTGSRSTSGSATLNRYTKLYGSMSGSLACDPVVYTGRDQCWIVWGNTFTGDTNIDFTSERPRGPIPDVRKVSV